jgi:hypothetical protein
MSADKDTDEGKSQYHQQLVQSVSIQTGRQKLHKVQKSVFHPIHAPKSSSAK